ncbi:MAG: P1 family peptidase [Clostridiales bacterium]|nr:P1 family peptidase [Clostridiales bacterium]
MSDIYYPTIELPEGITIGHASNSVTGCTAILCTDAVAGADVRGGAPGTRETDLLHNEKAMDRIDAVVLSGGSAYGLEASCGVMAYLRDQGKGFAVGEKVVPIVCSAVLFDLNGPDYNYPDAAMGKLAAESATCDKIPFGKVGAGTGATVGKIRGLDFADEGGIGAATVRAGEAFVTAVVAVNALGDVFDPYTNKIVAGAHANDGTFLDTAGCIVSGNFPRLLYGNTTIGCVITNAALTKVQANNLASVAHNGLARTIRPVHTSHDGDTLFCIAKGNAKADPDMLGVMAQEAVVRAVLGAVLRK